MTYSRVLLTNFKVFGNVGKHCLELLIHHSVLTKPTLFPQSFVFLPFSFTLGGREDERHWEQGWFKLEQRLVITHAQAPSKSCSSFVLIFLEILQRLLEDGLMLPSLKDHLNVEPLLICHCMCSPCYFILDLICQLIQS